MIWCLCRFLKCLYVDFSFFSLSNWACWRATVNDVYLAAINFPRKFSPIYWKGRVHASIRSLRNRFQGIEENSPSFPISPDVVQTQMDRARSWNSIAFHPPIPFIPRQKSSIVPGSRKYSSESWFSLSILPSSREISALKYSTRERLYPLRNLSMEYSKRSRCVTRAMGTGLECYPLETWWLETSRCWRDASFVDARRKSLDKQLVEVSRE